MAEIITRRPSIGISACVFGCPVRYNGRSFDALAVMGRERADFVWTPVCPECLAGLGVPRMPVHLTADGAEVLAGRAQVLNRHGRDVTEPLVAGATDALEAVRRAGCVAFIAKEASPSCGLRKARLGKRRTETTGAGVFGAMLLDEGLFLIPDEGLANPLSWWDWRRRLHAWIWLRERAIERSRDLYDAWHVVKFVVQETDRPFADEIGRRLAALPKSAPAQQLAPIRSDILAALARPSTKARIRAAAFKTWAHHRKHGRLGDVDAHGTTIAEPGERATADEVARALVGLERISFENDLLIGTSPVIRRDGRRVAAKERDAGE